MFFETGHYHRTFPSQPEFSFDFSVTPSNARGAIDISLTDNSGHHLDLFHIESGKIFDIGGKNVWSYNSQENLSISGNASLDYFNYFINQNPVCLYYPLSGSMNYYNGFDISLSGVSGDGYINIIGRRPNYDFISTGSGYLATEDIVLKLTCEEPEFERDFKIFSGIFFSESLPYGIRSIPINSGINNSSPSYISLSGSPIPFLTGDIITSIGAQIFTNFGVIEKDFILKILKAPIYYTDWITGFTGITSFPVPLSNVHYDYELRSVYPEDRQVFASLEFVTGYTGLYSGVVEYSGDKFVDLSGFIQGYDYITGYSFIETGYYYDLQGELRSGYAIGEDRLKIYPTGQIIYNYSLPVESQDYYEYSPIGARTLGTGFFSEIFDAPERFFLGGIEYELPDTLISGRANVTGMYRGLMNTATGVLATGTDPAYYRGFFALDDNTHLWSAQCVSGEGVYGEATSRIFIDGANYSLFPASSEFFSLGLLNKSNTRVSRLYNSGDYLESVIFYNNTYQNCEFLDPSLNTNEHKKIFLGNLFRYSLVDTGTFGTIKFNSPSSRFGSNEITHYGFNVDITSKKYPYIFSLQRSADGATWNDIDVRTAQNFYPSGSAWFKLSSPSDLLSYPYYRLNITSGVDWPHVESYSGLAAHKTKYSNSYGIRNLNFYESTPVRLFSNESSLTGVQIVSSDISGYSISDNKLELGCPNYVWPGDVIYSNDGSGNGHHAWKTFSDSNSSYIYTDKYGDAFVGFKIADLDNLWDPINPKVNSFYIDFGTNEPPKYLSFSVVSNGIESKLYETYDVKSIESGNFQSIAGATSFIFRFNKKSASSSAGFDPAFDTFSGIYTGDSLSKSALFSLKQELLPLDHSTVSGEMYFGEAFAIAENKTAMLVSAPGNGSSQNGSVYLFKPFGNYWTGGLENALPYPSGFSHSSYEFGSSLDCSFDGQTVVVGSKSRSSSNGAIFIYRYSSASSSYVYITGAYSNYYGRKVVINDDGDVIASSCPEISLVDIYSELTDSSANRWTLSQSLAPNTPSISGFGYDIDFSSDGSLLLVGYPYDNSLGTNAGAVHMYSGYLSSSATKYSGFRILRGDGSSSESNYRSDLFGSTVTINDNNNIICIGGPDDYRVTGSSTIKRGAIWTFGLETPGNKFGEWKFMEKLTSPGYDSQIGKNNISISKYGDFILCGSRFGPVIFSGSKKNIIDFNASPQWSYFSAGYLEGPDPTIYDIQEIEFTKFNPNEIYITSFKKHLNGAGKMSIFNFSPQVTSTDFVNPNYPIVLN